MPPLHRITPLILTYNEEANIGRTLKQLMWAQRVLVVDSGSDDRTADIVRSHEGADLLVREFDTPAQQWNFGLGEVDSHWTLALDADYVVPKETVDEIASIPEETPNSGFFADFDYVVLGRELSRSLYPPRQVLFRTSRAVFEDDGHTQRVQVKGASGQLSCRLLHDDRKSFRRWLGNQARYAQREAEKLSSTPSSELSLPDRVRETRVLAPPAVFLYCLFVKGLIIEGWPGWYYTLERTVAEAVISLAQLRAGHDGWGDSDS